MVSPWWMWGRFLISAVLVILGGIKLTRYADIVSDEFRLNKTWTGMVILGIVTSFPELAASLASVVFVNAPNLAIGNISGSININLMIVVLMDIFYRKGSVTSQIHKTKSYEFSIAFFGMMASIVVIEIFLANYLNIFALGPISYGSLAIVLIYVFGARIIFESSDQELHMIDPSEQKTQERKRSLQKLIISAGVVILGGFLISSSCDEIARRTLLGQTFVGVTFMGFVTSLPEIVVSLSALKMGAFDLAFGNVLGSNIFNIIILSICDLAYWKAPLFSRASPTHIMLMTLGVLISTILLIGIQRPKKKTYFGLGLDSILMLICFAIGMKFLYDLTQILH